MRNYSNIHYFFSLVAMFVILNTSYAHAQQLEQMWYYVKEGFDNMGEDIAVNEDGFVYVTGTIRNPSNTKSDIYTVKLSQNGDTLWTAVYGGTGTLSGYGRKIKIDSQGNIFVMGYIDEGSFNYKLTVIKYASNGIMQWVKRSPIITPSRDGGGLEIGSDNNIYAGGGQNGVIISYDANGNQRWFRNPPYSITSITLDNNNNIIATGSPYTIKYSSAGDFFWEVENPIGAFCGQPPPPTVFFDVITDNNNDILITGMHKLNCVTGSDVITRKFSASGQLLWERFYSEAYQERGFSLAVDNNNNIYVGGQGFAPIIKYNPSGSVLWTSFQLGSSLSIPQECDKIILDSKNEFLWAFGRRGTWTTNGGDLWPNYRYLKTVKLNTQTSNLSDSVSFNIAKTGSIGYGVMGTIDRLNNAYVTSSSDIEQASSSEFFALKYSYEFVPNAPKNISASFILDSIRLNFTDNSIIETGFKIQRSSNSGSSWNNVITLPAYNLVYPFRVTKTIHSSTGGSGALFRISAFNNNGPSDWIANNGLQYPAAPANLTSALNPGNKVALNWRDDSKIEQGFKIERRKFPDTTFQQIAQVSENITSYLDNSLPVPISGDKYEYRVRAYKNTVNSDYSNLSSILFDIPLAPDSLKVSVPNIGTAVLSWVPGSNNQQGFILERSLGTPNNFTWLDSIGSSESSYTQSGLIPGNIYYYRMYAYNSYGNSIYSDSVFVLITGDITHENTLPEKYSLYQNYPNPFNPATKIKFDIVRTGNVKLTVYDILGKEVASLVNEIKQPGRYEVSWNAGTLSSGIYFYKLVTSEFTDIKRLVLLK